MVDFLKNGDIIIEKQEKLRGRKMETVVKNKKDYALHVVELDDVIKNTDEFFQLTNFPNFKSTKRQLMLGVSETEPLEVYGVVSGKYQVITHDELIRASENYVNEFTDLIGYNGKVNKVVDFGNRNCDMMVTYRFEDISHSIDDGDNVCLNIILSNSYDGKHGILLDIGGYRFVCKNGLFIGEKLAHETIRHFYKTEEVIKKLMIKMEQFDKIVNKWRGWVDKEITIEQVKEFVEKKRLSKRWAEAIVTMSEFQKVRNLWEFYNIITYIATHVIEEKIKSDRVMRFRKGFEKTLLKNFEEEVLYDTSEKEG